MAYTVMAYIVMAYTFVAYIVVAIGLMDPRAEGPAYVAMAYIVIASRILELKDLLHHFRELRHLVLLLVLCDIPGHQNHSLASSRSSIMPY